MNSRQFILERLQQANRPFPNALIPERRLPFTPLGDQDQQTQQQTLTERFIQESEALSCKVQLVADEESAVRAILTILAGEEQILAWDYDQIPCSQLETALYENNISIAAQEDDRVLCGITGADAALASTGSLVLVSGPSRPRTTALLPQSHIAVISKDQILPNMEAWLKQQRQNDLPAFQQAANINIISGPSRTADIGMELIVGMHGPKNLHIILIENRSENLPGSSS